MSGYFLKYRGVLLNNVEMRKIVFIPLWFFAVVLSALKTHGQDQLDSLLELSLNDLMSIQVDVSAPEPTNFFEAPATITIIERNLIEKYDFHSVADALNMIAGVDVLKTSIDHNVTTIRGVLQGFYANKILLLINNEPTWNAIYGEGHIERININDVERIEVLKGPSSVYYGTNAYAGVVNLVLKKSDRPVSINAHGLAGAANYGESALSVNFNVNDWNVLLAYSNLVKKEQQYELTSTAGFEYQGDSTFIYYPKTFTQTFTAAVQNKSHNFVFNHFTNEHSYHGAVPSFSTGGGEFVSHEGYFANYSFQKKIAESGFLKLSATYDNYFRVHPFAADKRIAIVVRDTRLASKGVFTYRFSDAIQTAVGYDLSERLPKGHDRYDYIEDTLMLRNLAENNVQLIDGSAFIQNIAKYKKLTWHLGYRLSNNILMQKQNNKWETIDKDFTLNHSFSNALLYEIKPQMILRGMYGQSYRVPNIFELYFQSLPYVLGNLNMTPEKSESFELSLQTQVGNWYFLPVIYYAKYNDLLVRAPVEGEVYAVYQNANSFTGHGGELELRYHNSDVASAFVNYNFLNSDTTGMDKNYRYMPSHTVSFGASKELNKFYVSADGKAYSKIEGHLEDIDPQLLLNVHVGHNFEVEGVKVRHTLSLLNLTNSETLISAYTRSRPNINTIKTTNGIELVYMLKINI